MHKLSPELLSLITKECAGRKHLKLTIATLVGGEKTIRVFGETGEMPKEDYLYEIGSITKTFTTSLLGKYIHEGKMSLDDPISKYVDGLDDAYYPTLGRLATHTAGYGHFPATFGEGLSAFLWPIFTGARNGGKLFAFAQMNEEKMKRLLLEKKVEDKDYAWAYSNFGMGLVAYASGVVSGRGYLDAMDDYLANDLGMKNSYTRIQADKNLRGFSKKNKDIGNWDFGDSVIAGTGCISATADDMLNYARIQMNEELPYLKFCHEKRASVNKMTDIGLGWILLKKNKHVIMHTGGTGGFHTVLVIDKQKKIAYVMLANYLVSLNKFVMKILKELEGEGQ